MPSYMSNSRATQRFLSVIALSLLATSLPAVGATVRKARVALTTPKPVSVNNSIIPLPLQPIVPASQRLCTARTPSGLGYTILRAGPGSKPAATDTVLVNYVGYLAATGSVFDQAMQTPMPLDGVIPGFSEGIRLAGKAAIVRICIPAALGSGAQATGPIPANSDLVFQVELLDFKSLAEIEDLSKAQAAEPESQKGVTSKP